MIHVTVLGEWHGTAQFRDPMVKMKKSGNEDRKVMSPDLIPLLLLVFCVGCEQVTSSISFYFSMWKMEVTVLEYYS